MKKVFRRIRKILLWSLLGILLFLIFLGGMVHTSFVQQIIAGKASGFLSDFIGCEVRMAKLDFNLFKRTITLRGLEVLDSRSHRTIFAPEAMVTLKSYDFNPPTLQAAALYHPEICIRRYRGDSMSDFKRVLQQIAALPKKDTALRKAFVMETMHISDGSFIYDDLETGFAPPGKIDFKHVGLSGVDLDATDFYTRCGVVMAKVHHLACTEKSGFRVEDFASWIYVNRGEMKYASASIRTPASRVSLDLLFEGKDWKDYKDFVSNIPMSGTLKSSVLNLSDLGYFAPALQGMDEVVNLSGTVKGTVSRFDLGDFKLRVRDSGLIEADVRLQGLPEIRKSSVDLNLKKLKMRRSDWADFRLPGGKTLTLPPVLSALHRVEAAGTLSGNLDRFVSDMSVRTNVGTLHVRNTARDTADNQVLMEGNLSADNIRLDKLLKNDSLLGGVDADVDFLLHGAALKDMTCRLSGSILNLEIDGSQLEPIRVDMETRTDFFEGKVECLDPGLDFTLDGVIDFTTRNSRSTYEFDVRNLNLQPLHLLGDTGLFTVKTRIITDHQGTEFESANGKIILENTEVKRLGNVFVLDRLEADLDNSDTLCRYMSVRSSLLDVTADGQWSVADLGNAFRNTVFMQLPEAGRLLFAGAGNEPMNDTSRSGESGRKKAKGKSRQAFDLQIGLKNADSLLGVFYPRLSIPLGLNIGLHYASESDECRLNAHFPYIQIGKIACMNGAFLLSSDSNALSVAANVDKFYLDDSISMHDFAVRVEKTDTNTLAYDFSWGRDSLSPQATNASLGGLFHFLPEGKMRVEMPDFNLESGSVRWKSYPDGSLLLAKDSIVLRNVGMYSVESADGIRIEGELSHHPDALLRIDFSDFSLDYFEYFLRKTMMDIDARASGYAEIHDFYGDFLFNADLLFKDLTINRQLYGQGHLSTVFSRHEAIKASFEIKEPYSEHISLSLAGSYYPRRQRMLDFQGYVSDLPVAFLSRILSSVTRDMAGTLHGDLQIGGTLSSPRFSARIASDSLSATIPMLETRYTFRNFGLELSSDRIAFLPSVFYDPVFETEGTLGGTIRHRNFKDIQLDLDVSFANLLALHTKRSPGLPFWGTVFATGNLAIIGPTSDITMLLNAEVNDNSDISFDFSSPGGGSGANFISFVSPPEAVDSSRTSLEKLYFRNQAIQRRKGSLTMDLNLNITPGLAVSVGIRNTAMSGNLKATGKGALRLYMANGNPQLFGTYTVNAGGFDFSMVNLINKRFELKEGGTISWVGPMTDARVNVQAGYQTKASLYPVLAAFDQGDGDVYKQKVNVESIIVLSGNLMNPNIGFDIDLSNVDEDTKDKFLSVVRKDDEDEMLRQTFALLMFNTFMSVENSGSNVANTALASSSEILFSQFNNFLSKITSDFNIGLNYKPGDNTSNSEFQVMMSGQLFNDRLVINGNLGVSDKVNGNASTTTVVGDVDVEWKFTEELRLRGFNHSNDQDLTKPANSYTQGVSIVFRRDFDNAKEFLHGTRPRRSREERRAERRKNREIKQAKQGDTAQGK